MRRPQPPVAVECEKTGHRQAVALHSSPKVEVTTYLTIALESQNART